MNRSVYTDIAVIGGGSGGLTLAAGAAQMGAKVTLIEKGKMGGDCLNYGCVPSKSLLAAAHQAEAPRPGFGVSGAKPAVDFAAVNNHVKEVIASIAPHDSVERFTDLGVHVIQETAQFVSKRTIQAGITTVHARYVVIATGSSPMMPPIPGLKQCRCFSNETLFDNTTLPDHLLIIGGGPIGIEMAQAHARLGAQVCVMDMGPILPRDDPQLVDLLRQRLLSEGISLRERITIESVQEDRNTVTATLKNAEGKKEIINGSHLLVAAGRRANVQNLQLDKAGIRWSPSGVEVNARLQTSNRRVYAIGDIASPYQFTHVASYHAGIVIRNILFKLPAKADHRSLPWVTYTDPEIAHCGQSYEEAVALHGRSKLRRLEIAFTENDRARAERKTDGRMKVTVTKRGQILGVDIVGESAGNLIQPWCLAIQNKLKIGAMASHIAPYPTLGELSKRVAGSFYTEQLFNNPRLKKLVRLLLTLTRH